MPTQTKQKRTVTESALDRLHCLEINQLSPDFIQQVFQQAKIFEKQLLAPNKKSDLLTGRVVVNLFYENSTRTRSSFELAAKYLGADVLNFEVATSAVKKGETLTDTIETLLAMKVDALVIRHQSSGIVHQVAKTVGNRAVVINAGDGCHQHPTQALLDSYTLLNAFKSKDLKGKKITIVGDILHSRVARSDIQLFTQLGATVHVVGPTSLLPAGLEVMGCITHTELEPALLDADAVMALRIQAERQDAGLIGSLSDFHKHYGLSHSVIQQYCKPNVVILHPGPMNRGVEITSELADDTQYSLIQQQVANGVVIRMAVLSELLKAKEAVNA